MMLVHFSYSLIQISQVVIIFIWRLTSVDKSNFYMILPEVISYIFCNFITIFYANYLGKGIRYFMVCFVFLWKALRNNTAYVKIREGGGSGSADALFWCACCFQILMVCPSTVGYECIILLAQLCVNEKSCSFFMFYGLCDIIVKF